MDNARKVVKVTPWQMIVKLRGQATPHECHEIVDRLEEFAALLSDRWSEFSVITVIGGSADCDSYSAAQSFSKIAERRNGLG